LNGMDRLIEAIEKKQNPTVMGLDMRAEYFPEGFVQEGWDIGDAIYEYNQGLIDAAADIVPAVKPQLAFYEMYGMSGLKAYEKTLRYAKEAGLIIISDGKRGDIGSTAAAYAAGFVAKDAPFDSDFLTVNPYLGSDGIKPFTEACAEAGKGIFVLVKTSNPSGGELQDLIVDGMPIYEHIGKRVEEWGAELVGEHGYSSVGAVVGATYPEQGAALRKVLPHTFFLVPGYGAQGGSAQGLSGCFDAKGSGAIVNASRSIMCAYKKQPGVDYKTAARNEAVRMQQDLLSVLNGQIG